MKTLVEYIAASLVAEPRAVRVRETQGDGDTRIELRVARGDLGRVIGRDGRTARAIRSLLGVAGRKLNRTFALEILE
jgi:predicted RNA-binding protein YlqC (UPF0109 family)